VLNIPVTPVPSQIFNVNLASQVCTIKIYQRSTGLFLDLYVAASLIVGGVICQDANRIVRDAYLGFVGDLAFYDTQGSDDPEYSGLGSRWVLCYLEVADPS
jgi:hypothetical protein